MTKDPRPQWQIVLAELRAAGGDGVHQFQFNAMGLPRAAARVWDLIHKHGYEITSTLETFRGGEAIGARYRLIERQAIAPSLEPGHEPSRLFDPAGPGHHRSNAA